MADREGIEEITARLNNIRSVEPILGAMRTISLGSWQAALNRRGRIRLYNHHLLELFSPLLPEVARCLRHRDARAVVGEAKKWLRRARQRKASEPGPPSVLILIIGSERGLCGAFNTSLARYAGQELALCESRGLRVELVVLGSRISRVLERDGHEISQFRPLPTTTIPGEELACELTHDWLQRYERYELDRVKVIYNAYRRSTLYEPATAPLIPPPAPNNSYAETPWPPFYVDSDPIALYSRLIWLWTATELYRIMLDSAAAEHSARFQLMEGATQNCARLIEELTLALHAARQQAITAEMQELAAGAGLLGSAEE